MMLPILRNQHHRGGRPRGEHQSQTLTVFMLRQASGHRRNTNLFRSFASPVPRAAPASQQSRAVDNLLPPICQSISCVHLCLLHSLPCLLILHTAFLLHQESLSAFSGDHTRLSAIRRRHHWQSTSCRPATLVEEVHSRLPRQAMTSLA